MLERVVGKNLMPQHSFCSRPVSHCESFPGPVFVSEYEKDQSDIEPLAMLSESTASSSGYERSSAPRSFNQLKENDLLYSM